MDERRAAEAAVAARQHRIRALADVNRSISQQLDLEPLLQQITRAVAQLTGAHNAVLWEVDPAGQTLRRRAGATDPSVGSVDLPTVLTFEQGGAGWIARHRQPLFVEEHRDGCAHRGDGVGPEPRPRGLRRRPGGGGRRAPGRAHAEPQAWHAASRGTIGCSCRRSPPRPRWPSTTRGSSPRRRRAAAPPRRSGTSGARSPGRSTSTSSRGSWPTASARCWAGRSRRCSGSRQSRATWSPSPSPATSAAGAGPSLTLPAGTGASALAIRERRPVTTTDILTDPRITLLPDLRARSSRGRRTGPSCPCRSWSRTW